MGSFYLAKKVCSIFKVRSGHQNAKHVQSKRLEERNAAHALRTMEDAQLPRRQSTKADPKKSKFFVHEEDTFIAQCVASNGRGTE